jgi:hypothetical protein
MILAASRSRGSGSVKAGITKIKLIDRYFDYALRIVVGYIVLKILG